MVDRERFGSATSSTSTRWVGWMPLLLVAAFLYWSVALGLGGLSLIAANVITSESDRVVQDLPPPTLEPVPGHAGDSIVVHLEESTEPEDVNDNAGAVVPENVAPDNSDDDGTGRLPG